MRARAHQRLAFAAAPPRGSSLKTRHWFLVFPREAGVVLHKDSKWYLAVEGLQGQQCGVQS